MKEVFLALLNMSISASWLVLAVLLLRFCFQKAPKWVRCLLWGIVALRLLMPIRIESSFSLIPSAEVIPQNIAVSQTPAINSGIPAVNNTINPLFTLNLPQGGDFLQEVLSTAAIVWLAGVALLLIYSLIAYLRLRWQIRVSLPMGKNILVCDDVQSPFVLGVLRPRIYLPSGINNEQMQHVLAHEYAHIQRRDHWWKPLGFFLLTVYWFNPLIWVAYILLCRDIEQACDEKVIAHMDVSGKKGYSEALVACSVHRHMVMVCPVAFGEVGVKTRIKQVLNYKKPAFWFIMVSVAMCGVIAMCFLTDPIPCAHRYHSQNTIASTCTEQGMQTLTCDLCQHSYTMRADLLNHSYDEGVVAIEPTCVDHGSKVFTCTGCGIQRSGSIDITPHIPSDTIYIKEANCAEQGNVSTVCAYCQTVFVTEILETNDVHDLTETVVQEATCTKDGEGLIACSRCDYSESCAYEKLGHKLKTRITKKPTCSRFGYSKTSCTECGYYYITQLDIVDCEWVYWGNGKQKCIYCGWMTSAEYVSLIP